MKHNLFIALIAVLIFSCNTKDIWNEVENRTFIVNNSWAGESYTFIQKKDDILCVRQVYGSGVAIAQTIAYEVSVNRNIINLESIIYNTNPLDNDTNSDITFYIEDEKVVATPFEIIEVLDSPRIIPTFRLSNIDLDQILEGY